MAVSPSKIVVVRGDRSIQPYFVCMFSTFPGNPNAMWSKPLGSLLRARQKPVSYDFNKLGHKQMLEHLNVRSFM